MLCGVIDLCNGGRGFQFFNLLITIAGDCRDVGSLLDRNCLLLNLCLFHLSVSVLAVPPLYHLSQDVAEPNQNKSMNSPTSFLLPIFYCLPEPPAPSLQPRDVQVIHLGYPLIINLIHLVLKSHCYAYCCTSALSCSKYFTLAIVVPPPRPNTVAGPSLLSGLS